MINSDPEKGDIAPVKRQLKFTWQKVGVFVAKLLDNFF